MNPLDGILSLFGIGPSVPPIKLGDIGGGNNLLNGLLNNPLGGFVFGPGTIGAIGSAGAGSGAIIAAGKEISQIPQQIAGSAPFQPFLDTCPGGTWYGKLGIILLCVILIVSGLFAIIGSELFSHPELALAGA
jgi:hypothetical protein